MVVNADGEQTKLSSPWTLYIDRAPETWTPNMSTEQYAANLRKVYTINTIQEFWQIFNNIPAPHQMPSKYSFHLMRGAARRPIWEDAENSQGGCWKFKVAKRDSSVVWYEAILAAIGEQFLASVRGADSVIGISVAIREREDQLQVWNAASDESGGAGVIEKMQEVCGDVRFRASFYKAHQAKLGFKRDSVQSGASSVNSS